MQIEQGFSFEPEFFSGGDQYFNLRSCGQDIPDEYRFIQEMFNVIEDNQRLLAREKIEYGLLQITAREQLDPEGFRQGWQELIAAVQRGQWDKNRGLPELAFKQGNYFKGKARLTDPTQSQDSDQADGGVREEVEHPLQVSLTTNEGRKTTR
jgi:hypothetical protein